MQSLNMAHMIQEKVQVLSNTPVGPGCYRIQLSCHQNYLRAVPGQFVMVRSHDQIDPLLPRPFSIHRLILNEGITSGLELLYKVVGKGTFELSRKQPGDFIDMTGPLGRGFVIPANVRQIYLVAGGIGVAPMVFLLSYLHAQKIEPADVRVFLGAKSKADLLCQEDFASLGVAVHPTTDDGSSGDQCLVTDPVEVAVAEKRPDVIFACGPLEMLACVVGIAEKLEIPCQVSIETMMACGVGACLGCAVASRKDANTYLHACMDGPVFDAQELKF